MLCNAIRAYSLVLPTSKFIASINIGSNPKFADAMTTLFSAINDIFIMTPNANSFDLVGIPLNSANNNGSKQTVEDTSYLGADTLTGSLEAEAESLYLLDDLTDYTNEGTAFYADFDQQAGTVYSFFDAETGSEAERDSLENNLPNYESTGITYDAFSVDGEI